MKKIITISREFGSGGRELGKRLAEHLGIAYYDQEIITGIAQRSGLAEEYINNIVEKQPISYYPITIGRTFASAVYPQQNFNTNVYIEQSNVIEEMAAKSDCVIVGRCSSYILRKSDPYNVFVYSDIESRLRRCRLRAPEDERLSDDELIKKIKNIDKGRAKYHRFFAEQKWDDRENYNLCINTSNIPVKQIALPIAELLKAVYINPKNDK